MSNTYTLNYNLPKPAKADIDWDDEWHDALDEIDSLIKATNDALNTHISAVNNPHSVTFLQLTDTPSSYTGLANRVVVVNSTATGLTTVTRVPDSDKLGGYSPGTGADNILKLDAQGKISDTNLSTDVNDAVNAKHSQGTDTTLGSMTADIDMNSKSITNLPAPSAAGHAIRQTTKITEASLESAVDLKHKVTISTSNPSGGSDGDIWFVY